MNAEQLLYAIGNIRDDFVREASPDRPVKQKNYRPLFTTLGTLAACLALICLIRLPDWGSGETATSESSGTESTESTTGESTPECAGAPSITVDDVTYVVSSHGVLFRERPTGFTLAGQTDVDGQLRDYYTSPENPEWIYVYQECYDHFSGEPYYAYVRYVAEPLRGLRLIRYNGQLYCFLNDAAYLPYYTEVSPEAAERYDRVERTYSIRIEAETVDGFSEIGRATFEGYDLYPQQELGSNITLNEIWANPDEPDVLLARDYWTNTQEDHQVRHTGFLVYVLYEP